MRINIDRTVTILSIIGEEDTCLGFENDEEVHKAIEVLQTKIEDKVRKGEVTRDDALLTFH